jgi:hypothetical protein
LTAPDVLSIALAAAAWVEIGFAGRGVYHAGWFNVALTALIVATIAAARRAVALRRAEAAWTIAGALGGVICGFAAVANGLFAPDNHVVVGAPGQRVRVDDLGGSLVFPLAQPGMPADERVGFLGGTLTTFALRPKMRDVVYVEARDARGSHLTITQPTGAAFLSPVLLMQQHQEISGFDLPFDSFAVPAAHRIVRTVLFTPQQAAMLRGMEGLAVPAVLFAVDDDNDRPLPHGIALCVSGQTIALAGLLLHAAVLQYPAVEVVAIPSLAAVALGTVLVLGGFAAMVSSRRHMRSSQAS